MQSNCACVVEPILELLSTCRLASNEVQSGVQRAAHHDLCPRSTMVVWARSGESTATAHACAPGCSAVPHLQLVELGDPLVQVRLQLL